MKGFPNQVTKIDKLTNALSVLSRIIDDGDAYDDDSLGEALLAAGVINPGHGYSDIPAYLEATRSKPPSNQSHRTSARGIREFLSRAGLINTDHGVLELTTAGDRLLQVHGSNDQDRFVAEWKVIARNISAIDNEGRLSHPYRVMLRMLSARPGTPRAYCALALEAGDDSEEELQRVIGLLDLNDESAIISTIGTTKSNWDNAKKILPSIAEQIGDVARVQNGLVVVDAESYNDPVYEPAVERVTSRKVTANTIATTKVPEQSDEVTPMVEANLVSLAEAITKRADRNLRHNTLVQLFASQLLGETVELWEGLFDCLAVDNATAILAEMKTLDGSVVDEVHQVRTAVSQLFYYEWFALPPEVSEANLPLIKVAVFEKVPTERHIAWMESLEVRVVWLHDSMFMAPGFSKESLSGHIWLHG